VPGRGTKDMIAEFGDDRGGRRRRAAATGFVCKARVHPSEIWTDIVTFAFLAPPSNDAMSRCGARAAPKMAHVKQINCVCGKVVKGEDDDELWEKAQAHLRTDHPELVGKVSRKDILAQAEET
jgi:hypothetical protein